jgi:peptidoglycan hydrolase-like protein with peptidoglycan-binding domain
MFEKRGRIFPLLLGHLDPVRETTGQQMRLALLGLYNGETNGKLDEATQVALRRFQESMGLPATGVADDATLEALKSAFGC